MLQIADFIAERYRKVAEIGIGRNTTIAELLRERGVKVIATDIMPVTKSFEFYIDDILNPRIEIYNGVELVYSIRPPPELFSAIRGLAKMINADCLIKPLYGDYCDGRILNYRGVNFYFWKRNHGGKKVSD
ncbi:MAG: UPF0146 family protein [Archaeoglobaceae archaeon]|nr:UPF0146 family protein [Archaeoglobaceae archaeon]MDW7989681.1 UPF0146 family protein [Archaeoglobaceae archaeon]